MRFSKAVLILTLAAALGARGGVVAATTKGTQVTSNDPYLWLEDVHGEKALAWVNEQNARSRAVLKSDPDYQTYYDTILSVLDAQDRIPYGRLEHNDILNF